MSDEASESSVESELYEDDDLTFRRWMAARRVATSQTGNLALIQLVVDKAATENPRFLKLSGNSEAMEKISQVDGPEEFLSSVGFLKSVRGIPCWRIPTDHLAGLRMTDCWLPSRSYGSRNLQRIQQKIIQRCCDVGHTTAVTGQHSLFQCPATDLSEPHRPLSLL